MGKDNVVRKASEAIAESLRNDILSGRIVPQERLTERKIADRFHVSTAPVRECLMQLAEEGWLVLHAHRGIEVRMNRPEGSIYRLMARIRSMVEEKSLDVAFDNADEMAFRQHLTRLEVACKRDDYSQIVVEDFHFHRLIVELTEQKDLIDIWACVAGRVHLDVRRQNLGYSRPVELLNSHRRIVDSWLRGDSKAAEKTLARNLKAELH